jgi:hypothetical protein
MNRSQNFHQVFESHIKILIYEVGPDYE